MEHTGLEPVTSSLPAKRAPNCANAPSISVIISSFSLQGIIIYDAYFSVRYSFYYLTEKYTLTHWAVPLPIS